jgi:hypothetical protein
MACYLVDGLLRAQNLGGQPKIIMRCGECNTRKSRQNDCFMPNVSDDFK